VDLDLDVDLDVDEDSAKRNDAYLNVTPAKE